MVMMSRSDVYVLSVTGTRLPSNCDTVYFYYKYVAPLWFIYLDFYKCLVLVRRLLCYV